MNLLKAFPLKIIPVKTIAVKQLTLRIAFCATGAWLGGCASSETFINTAAENHWQLSGKIGLVYPESHCSGNDCRSRSDQGKIDWRQQAQTYAIRISDPFGRVVMRINGDNQQLQAQSADQAAIHTTPDEFVALIANNADNQALSNLSPAWLSYWVTGRPAPDTPISAQNGNQFVQQGYTVNAKQWRDTSVGKMPSLIVVNKDDFTLRLVVREWLEAQKDAW